MKVLYRSDLQKATFAVTSTDPLGSTLPDVTVECMEPLKNCMTMSSNKTGLLILLIPIGRVDVLDLFIIAGRVDFPLRYS